ncbi:hypothetical protein ElyMa_005677400 [Elysia marginata]|uniref:G-protein coupled receptors family 1 profile domain-containing protein n=1 Tax=Elysia marginata TaxID=1093978 RepID=A0AAV4FF87_9GAST|nr:hypothetical protein ElyMa_005677400 [Elysia marginata]
MDVFTVIASVLIFLLNGFILFRQWPSKRNSETISYIKLMTLVDPLVTAIVCPMASDLYFTPEWALGCSTMYTASIALVVLILYVSSLFVCLWLTERALPSPPSASIASSSCSYKYQQHCFQHLTPSTVGPLGVAFLWCAALNIILTCLLLPVVSKHFDVDENFDSEICRPYFLAEMMLNVFLTSVATQIAYIGLYLCICKANISEEELDCDAKTNGALTGGLRIVLLHVLTALLCLTSACLLRFIFMTCSCKGLFELNQSLPTVTFLMTLKLPCASSVSHLWPRQRQGIDRK